MARAGLVTNGPSVPVTWWSQLITGRRFFCICMARSTPDLLLEVGSPELWESFFFFLQTRDTRKEEGSLRETEKGFKERKGKVKN